MKKVWSRYWPWFCLLSLTILLTPLAATEPDGLERVLEGLGMAGSEPASGLPLADYQVQGINHPGLATLLAGLIGAAGVWGAVYLIGLAVHRRAIQR